MTVQELFNFLGTLKGFPKVVIQEEAVPYHKRIALIFNVHKQHRRVFNAKNKRFDVYRPVICEFEFKYRSHKWLNQKEAHPGATYTLIPAYANNDLNPIIYHHAKEKK